jgi:predicted DNA-binding protein
MHQVLKEKLLLKKCSACLRKTLLMLEFYTILRGTNFMKVPVKKGKGKEKKPKVKDLSKICVKASQRRDDLGGQKMTNSKKTNIMSLSIDPEIQEKIKIVAKKRNVSSSKLVRDIVEKHLSHSEEDIDTVVFKVPATVKTNAKDLRDWFSVRVESVVKALTSEK